MNPIQLKERVDFYMNRSRSSRFSFNDYNIAFREAQMQMFDMFKDDPIGIRDNLYTLKTDVTPIVTVSSVGSTFTVNHINYPSDYHYFGYLNIYVDGVLAKVSPMDDNRLNDILQNSFTQPTNKYIYQLEDSTGWKFWRGLGGTITAALSYLKEPSEFYMGNEADLIDETGTLTFGVNYTVVEETVYSGVTYNPGDDFTAVALSITSGQVIPTSVFVNTNLPTVVQEDLCKMVANLLAGETTDYNKAAFVEKEVKKTL